MRHIKGCIGGRPIEAAELQWNEGGEVQQDYDGLMHRLPDEEAESDKMSCSLWPSWSVFPLDAP